MPRKLRLAKPRIQAANPFVVHLLCTGKRPPPPADATSSGGYFECFQLSSSRPLYRERLREIWAALRDELLAEWITERPGSRPAAWWWCDSPEPRARLGGVGTPAHLPECLCGIPTIWFEFDPDDPPTFESVPAYLDRLTLWLPGERRRLTPVEWESEIVDLGGNDAA